MRGVRWEEGEYEEDENGKKTWIRPSRLIFPNIFNGEIDTDVSSISLFCPLLIKMLDCNNRDAEVLRCDDNREHPTEGRAGREAGPAGF